MKTIPELILSGRFLLVGTGESYSTEIVEGADVVRRVMAAMHDEDESKWTSDDLDYWHAEICDLDNWSHDPDFGPVRFKTDIGETDHLELIRVEPATDELLCAGELASLRRRVVEVLGPLAERAEDGCTLIAVKRHKLEAAANLLRELSEASEKGQP